jgi:hypothetical protein
MMDGENFSADSNVKQSVRHGRPGGESLPLRTSRSTSRPTPSAGTPRNAPRVRMRTGFPWRDQGRERGSRPVAASRDVQTHHSRPLRLRPDEPPRRIHRQDHRLAGRRLRALALALGSEGGEGATRHTAPNNAAPRPLLFRHQRANPAAVRDRVQPFQGKAD